ncbi:MAG: response regulator [Lachnospiraceae bacterium]|nr:response regulator [Lachnospiraceae bacterium]
MRKKILLAEDSQIDREMIEVMLNDKYDIIHAENGKIALDLLKKYKEQLSVALLDMNMPKLKGIDVLKVMDEEGMLDRIPVLFITGEESVNVEKECFKAGASDFIRKPFDFYIVSKRIDNIVDLYELRHSLEEQVEKQVVTIKKQYKLLVHQTKKLKQNNDKIAEILGTIVESRDYQDGTHIRRVKKLSEMIGMCLMNEYPEYGLTEEKVKLIADISVLHDIGKITIPDKILFKPGKLTSDEEEYMKSHTLRGSEMFEKIKDVWDKDVEKIGYNICRSHHERYDGNGFPDKLKGEDIPIEAQIVSIVDAYDNLVNDSITSSAKSPDEAFYLIVGGECGLFSPKLLECFRILKDEIKKVGK